jgi:putative flippase GtrA
MFGGSLVRFLLVGSANTVLGYGTILLFQLGLEWPPVWSNSMGYAVGLSVSYWLSRTFVFRSQRGHSKSLPLFAFVAVGCFGLNLLVLKVAVDWFALHAVFAQAIAIASYTIAFYLLGRHLVFRQNAPG